MPLKMRPSLIVVERPGNPVKPSTIGSPSSGGIDDGSVVKATILEFLPFNALSRTMSAECIPDGFEVRVFSQIIQAYSHGMMSTDGLDI